MPGVHLGAALHMVGVKGAREKVAREGLREKPSSVKLMEGVGAVNILDALRVLRVALISAYLMGAAAVAAMKGAKRQQEENLAFVLSMVGERDAKKRTVLRVRRDNLAFVLLMEVEGAANMRVVQKVHREALISANPMEVARDAHIQIAARVLRAAHSFVRAMEGANAVGLKVAQRMSMVAQSSVLPMEVESDVLYQDAPRVLEDEQTAVFVMVGAKDVKLPAAARVRRVALTFARLMGEAIVAYGANQELNLGWTVLLVSAFRGGENGLCVAHNALVEDSRVRGGETLGAMGSPGPVMNNNMVSHRLTGPFLEPQMVRRSSLSISVRGPAIFCVLQRLFLKCQSLLQKGGFVVVTLWLFYLLV